MSKKLEYNSGDTVGSCTFIRETEPIVERNITRRSGLFRCNCGNEFISRISRIKTGEVKSCGCLRDNKVREQSYNNRTHNKSYHPIFQIWSAMKHRCEDFNNIGYHLYGGRGITVCDRWQDVNNFIADMYSSYERGLCIDRIDNNGNYEPANCRWVTPKENSNNRRSNKIIEYNNESKTISQWADELDIPYWRLQHRLKIMNVDDAFDYCLNLQIN